MVGRGCCRSGHVPRRPLFLCSEVNFRQILFSETQNQRAKKAGASNSPGSVPSLLACLVRDYLAGCDLRWVRRQGSYILRHELPSLPARLLLSLLVLKDAGSNHYALPGVDPVVSHESRHFADDGQEVLLHLLRHLFGVSHTLVAPYCSVHSFFHYLLCSTLHTSNDHSGYFRSREESLCEVMVEANLIRSPYSLSCLEEFFSETRA